LHDPKFPQQGPAGDEDHANAWRDCLPSIAQRVPNKTGARVVSKSSKYTVYRAAASDDEQSFARVPPQSFAGTLYCVHPKANKEYTDHQYTNQCRHSHTRKASVPPYTIHENTIGVRKSRSESSREEKEEGEGPSSLQNGHAAAGIHYKNIEMLSTHSQMDDWILEDVEINGSGTRDHLHGTHDGIYWH
jgi:hypothetical protein